MALKNALRDPLFLSGLAIKLALALFLVPAPQADWFIPFYEAFWRQPGFAPWELSLGNPAAFPYGIAMFLTLLPGSFLDVLVARPLSGGMPNLGIMLTLIAVDVCLFGLLCRLLPGRRKQVLLAYWLSPIVFVGIYWVGQLDTIPVCLLFAGMLALRQRRHVLSGFLLAAACSAKLSMLVVLPFFFIYLFRTPRLRPAGGRFLQGLAVGVLALWVLPLFQDGYRRMVLGTPETLRLFDFHVALGEYFLYLTPIIYGFGLYFAWRMRRMTFDLFCAVLGLSFFLLVFSTPAPPGWYLWIVPFITIFYANAATPHHKVLLVVLSICVSLTQLAFWPGPDVPFLGISLRAFFPDMLGRVPAQVHSIWISLLFFLALVTYCSMLTEYVYRNKAYIARRRPLGIAVAGDSGTGKDRLARVLAGIFGSENVAHISGDDYHMWDRAGAMWQSFTHLHPGANNLRRFSTDVADLFSGRNIVCREYDHTTGRFNPPRLRHANDVVIITGLHALAHAGIRSRYDVSIYLDMDEDLRRWFKCRRDSAERGHALEEVLASIERRQGDAAHFIRPQREVADMVFSLYPVSALRLDDLGHAPAPRPPQLGLRIMLRNGYFSDRLIRYLIGLCGMRVDMQFARDCNGGVTLTIEGELSEEDTGFIAGSLFPSILELLALKPQWAGGMDGIMQLMVLGHLAGSLETQTV